MLYTSGQLPLYDGKLISTGLVGRDLDVEEAKTAAHTCALNILAQAKTNEDLGELAGSVGAQTGWLKDDVSTLFETYGWPTGCR